MRDQTAILFFVGVLFVFGILGFVIVTQFVAKYQGEEYKPLNASQNIAACVNFGCSPNSSSQYLGSTKTLLAYDCACLVYANQIKKEDIICFESKEDIKSKGYRRVVCP